MHIMMLEKNSTINEIQEIKVNLDLDIKSQKQPTHLEIKVKNAVANAQYVSYNC